MSDGARLGPSRRGGAVDFGVAAPGADRVELCLFAGPSGPETDRIPMERGDDDAWRATITGAPAGLAYGFRAHGSFDPSRGSWFDAAKLLVDPRAPAITPGPAWHPALLSRSFGQDTGALAPRGLLADDAFDWAGDARPRVAPERRVIYECHVKNMTARHPGVPAPHRGTYLGLASEPVIDHLLSLGVTTVELMPVAHFVPQRPLLEAGRPNAWGYSPLGFLAPHAGWACDPLGGQAREMKQLVHALHAAGLEVILDACLGHGCEGDEEGLTLSLRGLGSRAYFRHDERGLVNWSGCGNTIDASSPVAAELILGALRHWAAEYRVDGFRFDLAVLLGRGPRGFDARSPLLEAIASAPELAGLLLVAEPWDATGEGHALGRFPARFAEWNDAFRDDVRSFWRGDAGLVPRLATRLGGSSDVFPARGPLASVHFVTCHDGFTLRDLVSYERKHNEANGEGNRDGHDDNRSRNWGAEGPAADPAIRATRLRVMKSLAGTLALARGVPLLSHGDELGRTQAGNNNAYCQDSELTHVAWAPDEEAGSLLAFVREALALRARHPSLRGASFFAGARDGHAADVTWLRPEGGAFGPGEWHDGSRRALGMLVAGDADHADVLALFNAHEHAVSFVLPGGAWRLVLDASSEAVLAGGACIVPAHALVVAERTP